jgi:hypothetical protein
MSVRGGGGAIHKIKNKIIDKSSTPSRSGGKKSGAKIKQPKTPKSANKEGSKTPKVKLGDTLHGVSMVSPRSTAGRISLGLRKPGF